MTFIQENTFENDVWDADTRCIFDNFVEIKTRLHKEVLLILPYFSLVFPYFHWSWTEDRPVLWSLEKNIVANFFQVLMC